MINKFDISDAQLILLLLFQLLMPSIFAAAITPKILDVC